MLLDCQIVPQTIVKPKSFVGLMALYESNYLRLLHLIPELERIDGCFRSRVAGDCELHADILEQPQCGKIDAFGAQRKKQQRHRSRHCAGR